MPRWGQLVAIGRKELAYVYKVIFIVDLQTRQSVGGIAGSGRGELVVWRLTGRVCGMRAVS